MKVHTQVRLRSRVADAAIESTIVGKVLSRADFDVLLTGPTRVLKPDGQPLCIYLPGAVAAHSRDAQIYTILHDVRGQAAPSKNRGVASGTLRLTGGHPNRSYALQVESSVVGAVDPLGQMRYCRLTAWTGQHLPEWQRLQPLLQSIAGHLADHVPDRYALQSAEAARSDPAWVVPGTPFSTVTINNTYPTGVHKDKGDLEAGFSTIACLRRGTYTGGQRISVVCYFRTKIVKCGTPEEEFDRASARGETRGLNRLPPAEAVADAGQ